MDQSDENEARRITQIRYVIWYVLVLIFTLKLIYFYINNFCEPIHAQHEFQEFFNNTGDEKTDNSIQKNIPIMPGVCVIGQCPAPKKMTDQLDDIEKILQDRLHPEQKPEEALIKAGIVVSLSFLWFLTFQLVNLIKNWVPLQDKKPWRMYLTGVANLIWEGSKNWLRNLSLIRFFLKWLLFFLAFFVPILFALSMYKIYEPAVFMMALVAIFVAAEHYGGLTETEYKLEKTTTELAEAIKKTESELEKRTSELKDAMGTILNADGALEWRNELYRLYSNAKFRIDAVIRHFDIDNEWWQCGKAGKPWDDYQMLVNDNDHSDILLKVLMKCEAEVEFVSKFPLPMLDQGLEYNERRGRYFYDFLGLAWRLVVLDIVMQARIARAKDNPTLKVAHLRVKISTAACWMHVVDDTVYQIIERKSTGGPTVREITRDIKNNNSRVALIAWARRSVRQFGQRGGLAEEYIFSVLRYEALKHFDESVALDYDHLVKILNKLGMADFIQNSRGEFCIVDPNDKQQGLTLEEAEKLCVAVFQKLLTDRCHRSMCRTKDNEFTGDVVNIQQLAYEVV